MVFNATFNNIFCYFLVVSFVGGETEVPAENYRPVASY
jgi:hypothetical protein